MGLTEVGLIVSGVVALITGYLTHIRSTRAHKDTVVIDQQTLVNETYELVLVQVRAELERKDQAHARERKAWSTREEMLTSRIAELETELRNVREELSALRAVELRVEETQEQHLYDDHRHVVEDPPPRMTGPDSGEDLPT